MPAAVKPEDEIEPTFPPGQELVDESSNERYRVLELVGRGGMGEVSRAVRLSDGAHCAVKCVRGDMVDNKTVALRTRFEALAFRKITHPNVVRVHGTGILWGRVPWMCMDWLEGFTLAEIIELHGRIPIRWAVEIVRDLCCGLQAIHPVAIHRDIKPSNAHFGLDAVTRALDLGAAKPKEANVHLTSTGFQVGTVPFMAPEQLDNTIPVDHRADLWAATIILYMLITGVHPFAVGGVLAASKIKLGMSILTDPHRPLLDALKTIPPRFGKIISEIIDRGLAKDPEDRHRSAAELVEILTALLALLGAETEHAEPLSSLVPLLLGKASRTRVAPPLPLWAPPQNLWTPPRTTEVMPPPAPRKIEVVQLARALPRTTEPMPAPVAAPIAKEPPPIVDVQDLLIADAEPARRTSAVVRRGIRRLEEAALPTAVETPRPRPTESTDRDTALPSEPMLVPLHAVAFADGALEEPRVSPPPLARREAHPIEVGPVPSETTAERAASPLPALPVRRVGARQLAQVAIFLGVVAVTVGTGLGTLHALGSTRAGGATASPASTVAPVIAAPARPSSDPSASPPSVPSASPAPSASASSLTPSPSTMPPPRPVVSGPVAAPRPPTTPPRRAPPPAAQPADVF